MRNYFCGWYFRCQSHRQTLAVIPSLHQAGAGKSCALQLITDAQAFQVTFPYADFCSQGGTVCMAGNRFSKAGMALDVRTPQLQASGSVRFGAFTPIRYDIMGPFRCVPFMQCRHSVYSMRHSVDGTILVNGTPYVFQNSVGYCEGDRGYSFPRKYTWTQCSFPAGALMLSIAEIPLGGLHFTGVIGVVLLGEKEYRLATYLGARAAKITAEEIIVRQGRFTLTVRPRGQWGHPLRAPVGGVMVRTIHEHPSCAVSFRFTESGAPLLELEGKNAAFEYEY